MNWTGSQPSASPNSWKQHNSGKYESLDFIFHLHDDWTLHHVSHFSKASQKLTWIYLLGLKWSPWLSHNKTPEHPVCMTDSVTDEWTLKISRAQSVSALSQVPETHQKSSQIPLSTGDMKSLTVIGEILRDYRTAGYWNLSNILSQITTWHTDVSKSSYTP